MWVTGMKFKYKKYLKVLRPVIPIKVVHKDFNLPYEVLVDSGADFCIFDAQLAPILGIVLETGDLEQVSGVTGVNAPIYFHNIVVNVGGWEYEIKCAFLKDIGKFGYGVVGQNGFFDKFIVKFDLLKEEIELKPRS